MDVPKDGSCNTLIALLDAGKVNCCLESSEPQQKPEVKKPSSGNAAVIERTLFEVEETNEQADEEKATLIAQKKAEEAAIAAEKARKAECEDFIQEAVRLKNDGDYRGALKKLDKARRMKVSEKAEAIDTLEKEVLKLKSENSLWGNITKKVGKLIGDVLEE